MTLRDRLLEDIKVAMKAKDAALLEVLRFLNSAIKNREIEMRPNALNDQEVVGVIQKLSKQRLDSIEQFTNAGRKDLADKESSELEILKGYLPTPLSETEVRTLVQDIIAKIGAAGMKDMGRVMKEVQEKAQGKADGKFLSTVVKEKLSQA